MLSSLFPRSSIYKSLDDDRHSHAFDAGNTALFNADELEDEDEHGHESDHAAAAQGSTMTGEQRGHRYQPSLPDPFEHMPKTGTIPTNLPLITSAPTSPSPAHDRPSVPTEGDIVAGSSRVDPFEEAQYDYNDDPMAAMSHRLNSPYAVGEHDGGTAERTSADQRGHHHPEAEPPRSM